MITEKDIRVAVSEMKETGIIPSSDGDWTELATRALVAVSSKKYRKKRKHGHRRDMFGKESSTHRVWRCMKDRCLNKNHTAYDRYGGRGIKICDRWLGFENFLDDMGIRPEGSTLDRIDNDKGYCPENCRWATRRQQQRNVSNNRLIPFRGREVSVAAAAEEVGIDRRIVYKRLNAGWPAEKALLPGDFRKRQPLAVG